MTELHENEIIMLVLGLGVLVFVLLNCHHLKRIPWFGLLLTAFCILIVGWVMTVLEGFFAESLLLYSSVNFLEHLFYTCSGIIASVWCWGALGKAKGGGR